MAKKQDNNALNVSGNKIDYIAERNALLKDIPYETVRRAWFTLSHLLLDDGATILDMGCEEGERTYAMAALRPDLHFIGVDKSKETILTARELYHAPNLEFKIGDVTSDLYEPETIDAIINSYTLHQIFSNARYNERIVTDTLRKQFAMLKNNGTMFIRDYAKPEQGDFVLLEMHDDKGVSKELADLSEADLLVWYAEHARPKQDPGCGGFFLEELPPRFPRTRLFRLPYKWAYEFIMRKDNREIWESRLPFEYTFFTVSEFRQELRALGSRVQYSAPHWNEDHIKEYFDGHFRLLETNGDPLGDPPTSFIAVARKQPERTSLNIKERRIDTDETGVLEIKTLRDQTAGTLVDIVTRDQEMAEILPYHLSDKGQLYVYLHDDVVRGITNSVRRSGVNIDGREWSGHMLEAISINHGEIKKIGQITSAHTGTFTKSYLGLRTQDDGLLEQGPSYYPDPNYIDERIHTYYVPVHADKNTLPPKRKILETHNFREKGLIRKMNAQAVLDAIAVGLIPNSRLELQILSLMQHLNVRAENWISKDLSIAAGNVTRNLNVREFLRQISHSDKRFKEVKGSAGQLRTINSVFIEEGVSQGGRTGLSAEHVDFVLSDEQTINTAVVLPLTKSASRDIHAGFMVKHMPVPQRFEGNGLSVSAPTFNIPKDITSHKMLKQFIAEKFGVTPDMVVKLGESYFTHIGITPQRIHPFAVIGQPDCFKDKDIEFMPMYQYMLLWKKISKEQHCMTVLARAYLYLPEHMKLQAKHDVSKILHKIFEAEQPDFSLPSIAPSNNGGGQHKKDLDHDLVKKDMLATPPPAKKAEKKKRLKFGFGAAKNDDIAPKKPTPKSLGEAKKAAAAKHAAAKHLDFGLIKDFKAEIAEIKRIEDSLKDALDNMPKPEKW